MEMKPRSYLFLTGTSSLLIHLYPAMMAFTTMSMILYVMLSKQEGTGISMINGSSKNTL